MRVEDVMTTEVWTVRSDTRLKEAAGILTKQRISGLPVLMKDFLITQRQLDFAVSLGASASGSGYR